MDSAPFGPEAEPIKWTHRTMAQLDGSRHRGSFAQYDGGGHVVDLPSNRTAALLAIEQLEQQGFVDRATRAVLVDRSNPNPNPNPSPHPHPNPSPNPHADQVFVDLSAFNANVGMFYSARILFEFLPSGGIVPRRPSNPCPSPSPSTPNPDPNPQP